MNNPLCLNEHYGSVISLEARRRGANKGHEEKDNLGRSVNAVKMGRKGASVTNEEKDDLGRSVNAVKGTRSAHRDHDELGRSVTAVKAATALHEKRDSLGRSVIAVKSAEKTNSQKWKDPQHPDLGEHNPGVLVRMQKSRGYPYGKENRVKIG